MRGGAEARKFRRIFNKYRPPGIKVIWRKDDELKPAEANLRKRTILAPRLLSIDHLEFALHECGHYLLRHFSPNETDSNTLRDAYCGNVKKTVAEMEHECERWTLAIMRLEGLTIPRPLLGECKRYVAELLEEDTLKKKSPRHVRRWAQR